jgi:uncharacterized protein (TIGR00288 family)
MASFPENISMAVFCDFENVALGVRDANYEKFDIKPVLERLLLKGSIVVKKAYCDWDRYKSFKGGMHEANFELIEIPHVRQSGKNSADIRLVVDALDLCYTKSHVDTFVIISGDSDFSPLVSKLRENAKKVIGVGVKQSTSDLLVANCDEFIFYDDLVREIRRAAAKRDERKTQPQQGRRPASDENNRKREEMETRKLQALDMVAETFDALVAERGDTGKIWASLLKDTLKRRRPDFNETYFGFRTFGNLLEEAQTRGLFEFGRDEKSGTYVFRSASSRAVEADTLSVQDATMADPVEAPSEETVIEAVAELVAPGASGREPRRRGGRGRKGGREQQGPDAVPANLTEETSAAAWPAPTPDLVEAAEPVAEEADEAASAAIAGAVAPLAEPDAVAEEAAAPEAPVKERRRAPRAPRKTAVRKEKPAATHAEAVEASAPAPEPGSTATPEAVALDAADAADQPDQAAGEVDAAKPARKKSSRPARKPADRAPRRPAKAKSTPENG